MQPCPGLRPRILKNFTTLLFKSCYLKYDTGYLENGKVICYSIKIKSYCLSLKCNIHNKLLMGPRRRKNTRRMDGMTEIPKRKQSAVQFQRDPTAGTWKRGVVAKKSPSMRKSKPKVLGQKARLTRNRRHLQSEMKQEVCTQARRNLQKNVK